MAIPVSTVIHVDAGLTSFFSADRSDSRLKALDAEMRTDVEDLHRIRFHDLNRDQVGFSARGLRYDKRVDHLAAARQLLWLDVLLETRNGGVFGAECTFLQRDGANSVRFCFAGSSGLSLARPRSRG
jgi:hypothetical protein